MGWSVLGIALGAGHPGPFDFCRPRKPTDNAFIEAFDGRSRQECLNENWFLSLEDAVEKVESWRRHYNGERPHSALGDLSPWEFVALAT